MFSYSTVQMIQSGDVNNNGDIKIHISSVDNSNDDTEEIIQCFWNNFDYFRSLFVVGGDHAPSHWLPTKKGKLIWVRFLITLVQSWLQILSNSEHSYLKFICQKREKIHNKNTFFQFFHRYHTIILIFDSSSQNNHEVKHWYYTVLRRAFSQ